MKSTVERVDTEELLKILSDEAPIGSCIMQDGKFCYINSFFSSDTGYTANELVGKDSFKIVVPEDREIVRENTVKMLKGELTSPYQFKVICKDGSIRWVMAAVKSVQYHGRRAILGNYMEATEHKKIEDAMRESEERYRVLSEEAPAGVCIMQDGRFCYINSKFPIAIGYTVDELVGKDSLEIVVPEDREMVRENTIKMLKGELTSPYQFRVICRDGNIVWVMATVKSIQYHGRRAVLGSYMEITERKQMEETLKEREERYRELANSITDVFFAMDEHLRYTYWNKASEVLTGIRAENAIGKSLQEIFPDTPWRRRAEKVYRKVLRTQQPQTFVNDYGTDGRHYIFEISAYPSQGGISVFVRDITEHKQVEERIKESEQKYRLLFETSLDCITQLDREGRYLAANPATARSLGVPIDELIGKTIFEVAPQEVAQHRLEMLRKALDERQPQIFEDERAGRYFSHIYIPTKTSGHKEVVQGIARDITERREMEDVLRQSEEKYKALFDSSVIGMFVMDAETMKIVMANKAAARMMGFSSAEEAIGINPIDLVHQEDKDKAFEITIKEMFEQDLRRTHEYRVVNEDDREGWVSVTGARIMHEGRLAGLVSITDITDRKQAVETLRQSEERYRTMLEEMEDAYSELDLGGHFTFVNNSVCRDLRYSREELMGMSYKKFTAEDDIESLFRAFNEVYRTGVPNKGFSWKTTRKDGTQGFAESSISPIRNSKDEIIGFRSVGRDISERKKSEEKLRQSEERYRALFDSSVIGTLVLDAETLQVLMGNEAALKIFGFNSLEEGAGINVLDFVPQEDRELNRELIKRELFEQDSRQAYDVRAITKDGRAIWINVTGVRMMYKGRLVGMVTFIDITERKRMEKALRQSEENYRALFDSSVIGTIVIDAETMKVVMANQAAAKMFGFSSVEEGIGVNPLDFVPTDDRERVSKIIVKEMFEQDLRQTNELHVVTKDGREIWISASGTRITHEGRLAGLISFTDITEKRQQNERLIMADRLASIGELAAGTAHELNNPLTSVIGFAQLLMEKDTPDYIRRDLAFIKSEAQRAITVTSNLLTFARKYTPEKRLNQINEIIEGILQLRAYAHKSNGIEIERHFAPNLPEIMVDYFQMQQVFLNIIINAEYFITEAHKVGTLTITTGKHNNTVRISFADDGRGIPPENLSRIFDPFFTTKEPGKGTGLGLSICHGIVAEHGGQIHAKSQPGKGATIFVELPINGSDHIRSVP